MMKTKTTNESYQMELYTFVELTPQPENYEAIIFLLHIHSIVPQLLSTKAAELKGRATESDK